MDFQPLHDRVIVRRIEIGTKSESGIITAAIDIEERGDTCFGRVVAVGEGKQLEANGKIPMTVKIDDVVVYNARIPLKFPWNGTEYGILRESDILSIVSGDDVKELDASEVAQFEARKSDYAPKARVIA